MMSKGTFLAAVLAVGLLAASPASATVTVFFVAQDSEITSVGGTVSVDIMASMTEPIIGWGLDLTIGDTGIANLVSFTLASPPWDPPLTGMRDADGLTGFAFPSGLTGTVPLGTLVFHGNALGITPIALSYTPGDETEGFAIDPTGFDTVNFIDGTVEVTPEPASLALLALGALALRRR
jgi:hypothetical protein